MNGYCNGWEAAGKVIRFAVLALLLALLGCGASGTTTPPPATGGAGRPPTTMPRPQMSAAERMELRKRFANVLPPQAYVALAQLGMPAGGGIARGDKGVSVTLPHDWDATAEYAPGDAGWIAKSADVTETGPPFLGFEMAPSGTTYPDNFSYIVYRVDDVTKVPQLLKVYLGLSLGNFGVGVYNWSWGALGRWEPVFYGPAGFEVQVDLNSVEGADWTNNSDDLAIVIFCLNPVSLTVGGFELSDESANAPPLADLWAIPGSGKAPFAATLDATGSWDEENAIVAYRFDPLGDGNFTEVTEPTFDYTYNDPGIYQPVVEVVDDAGQTSQASTQALVMENDYDEEEDNDEMGAANQLQAAPFTMWSGNCGEGGEYNGDIDDWFLIDANNGDELSFVLNYDMGLVLEFWDSSGKGSELISSWGADPAIIQTTLDDSWMVPPYYIHVTSWGSASDYYLSCDDVIYSETEHNDDVGSANFLTELNYVHEFGDFDASLGSGPGYPGYDGDSDDWYTFNAPEGAILSLDATFAAGNALGVTLFDANANQIVSDAGNDGDLQLSHTFGPDNAAPFYLHFNVSSGFSDYAMGGTLTIPNPGYSEDENNDNHDQTNLLPAVPFADFTGNVGEGGIYDGDSSDYFTFEANVGDRIKFTITPDDPSVGLSVQLDDSNFDWDSYSMGAVETDPVTGVVTANALVRSGTQAPYFLIVSSGWTGATDYTIEAEVGSFSETEDNDETSQANALPTFPFLFFSGSIGSGGSNYDGDNIDVFTFDGQEGDYPEMSIYIDEVTGIPTVLLKDADGDQLGEASYFGGGYMYLTPDVPFGPGDSAPFYVEVSATTDYTDYWIEGYK